MFVKTTNVGFAQRVVATLVACAVVMASYGFYATAQAANLTFISNTLSDSNLSALPSHTIDFTVPAGSSIAPGDDITITWDSQDDGAGGQDFGGINAILTGDVTYGVNAAASTNPGSVTTSADSITFAGITAAAGNTVQIVVAEDVITNPAVTASFEIEVTVDNATEDLGRTRVAILDNVLVTAIVDTAFEFIVTGLATTTDINGDDTTGSTSPTEIAFGTLTAGTPEILGQQLNVTTNSRNGFSVTVQTDGDLRSSTGAVIDNFVQGSDLAVAGTAWAAPTPTVNDPTSWGHWGLTSDDTDLADELVTGTSYIAASTSPREVFSHSGPSDGTTQDIGLAQVAYQIQITPLQEAADDYQTTLTYVATPTF